MNQMKIGARYLPKRAEFPDTNSEQTALLRSLNGAPSVVAVEGVEPHFKGGHRASLVIDRARLDDFIAFMDAQGWLGAI